MITNRCYSGVIALNKIGVTESKVPERHEQKMSWSTISAAFVDVVGTQRCAPFLNQENNDGECSDGIGPPPPESSVEDQTEEHHGRQIDARLGLAAVGFHRSGAKVSANSAFGTCEGGHHDERHHGESNAESARVRLFTRNDRTNRFDTDNARE
jgi:hypothetical protein